MKTQYSLPPLLGTDEQASCALANFPVYPHSLAGLLFPNTKYREIKMNKRTELFEAFEAMLDDRHTIRLNQRFGYKR